MFEFRKFRTGDYARYAALVFDETVMRMNYGRVFTEEEAQLLFGLMIEVNQMENPLLGYSQVYLEKTGEYIGLFGITKEETIEIEYMLLPPYWGLGYATAMVKEQMQMIYDHYPSATVRAITDPQNLASKKVLDRNGFRWVRDYINDDGDLACVYERRK